MRPVTLERVFIVALERVPWRMSGFGMMGLVQAVHLISQACRAFLVAFNVSDNIRLDGV